MSYRKSSVHIVVFLCVLACRVAMSQASIGTGTVLRELYDLQSLPFLKSYQSAQFSSYDRSGGNGDAGNYLSDKNNEKLMADITGPGCITRIWSANPEGILKVYLDGETQPRILTPFQAIFQDKYPPFTRPLSTTSSGGWISYFPITFAKSCKVVDEGERGFYYHVTYRTYPDGTKIEPFARDIRAGRDTLDKAIAAWNDPARAFKARNAAKYVANIPARSRRVAVELKGPACIDELAVKADFRDDLAIKRLILRIYWDGEKTPSVESPLADFFGNGFGRLEYASIPMGLADGAYYCRFPMPFGKSAVIELENGLSTPQTVELRLATRKLDSIEGMGLFHATWHKDTNKGGIPYAILKATGKGHFVGCVMNMEWNGLGMLEGDELIFVDGKKVFNGTGTEDYFNSGWYFSTGPVAQPLHGATVREDAGRVQAYRFHLTDCVPFTEKIDVLIEHGGMCDVPGSVYSSVAYWYQIEPHSTSSNIPPASQLAFGGRSTLPTGTILAENVVRDKNSFQILAWPKLSESWKGGNLVMWEDNRSADFQFSVPAEDVYEIQCYFASGENFGKVAASIGGKLFGRVYDGYNAEQTAPAAPFSFGKIILQPGEHRLTLTVVGKHPASTGTKVAIEGLRVISASPHIRDWYVIGPFPNEKDAGFDTVYGPELDGYKSSAIYSGVSLKRITWKKVTADPDGSVDLVDHCGNDDFAVAYAVAVVIAPKDMEAEMLVGSNDGVKVWLNSKLVHNNHTHRPLTVDEDSVRINLKKGSNLIMLKVDQGGGGWGFSTKFRDPKGVLKYGLPAK